MEEQQLVKQHAGLAGAAAGAALVTAGASVVRRASERLPPQARRKAKKVASTAILGLPAAVATAWLIMLASKHVHGFVLDRWEDRLDELPEFKRRRLMLRNFRHSLTRQQLRDWLECELLGPDMRELFWFDYYHELERDMRLALPGVPVVFRLEIIWLDLGRGWLHVSALLDPFFDNNGTGLKMSPAIADELNVHNGQVLAYSIAGHQFRGPVMVEAVPDSAAALQMARQESAAASQPLNQQQLECRAEEIVAERRRCVVVPAPALRALLQAGVSIDMR